MKTMVEKHSAGIAYAASSSAVIFGMSAVDFAAYVGAGTAILTFAVNLYFKVRADKRAQALCKTDAE